MEMRMYPQGIDLDADFVPLNGLRIDNSVLPILYP